MVKGGLVGSPGQILNIIDGAEPEWFIEGIEEVTVYYIRPVRPLDITTSPTQHIGLVEPALIGIKRDHRGKGIRIAMRDMQIDKKKKDKHKP
jgi:hypothetical protein